VPGEAAISAAVEGWFRELGGAVDVREELPGRPSVYGIWRGKSDRWIAVDIHVDTVSVEQMTEEPFDGRIEDGRVYGRGSVDTKATLGVVLALLEDLHQRGERPAPNLLVGATVDEEVTAHGAPAFAAWVREKGLPLEALAVAEPTMCGPVIAHKGLVRLIFTVKGVPAHSSQPHFGKNAITAAARLITALDEEHHRLQREGNSGPLGPGTLTVTLVEGGSGANVVPEACKVTIDRRLVPGEDPLETRDQILEVAREACPLPFEWESPLWIHPFSQCGDGPWVRQLAEWSGMEPTVVPYGTNAWAYGEGLAKEVVVIGPGSIDQAHGVAEWVAISELEKLAGIYGKWWGME
jgi:acetylornithine deacetylase/succinyl-diaminopimelate desuccinylase-like protein